MVNTVKLKVNSLTGVGPRSVVCPVIPLTDAYIAVLYITVGVGKPNTYTPYSVYIPYAAAISPSHYGVLKHLAMRPGSFIGVV